MKTQFDPITYFAFLKPVQRAAILLIVAISTLIWTQHASGQTTNAFDQASSYTFNQPFDTLNNGFGFEPWTVTLVGNGGHFIQNNGPSGQSFDLWNTEANGTTIAIRPFTSAMVPGQSFNVMFRLNNLDGPTRTNGFILEDASGNPLFFYWHVGGDNLDGHYSDGAVVNGTATNFPYAYQQFQSLGFHLTSATTYTFTDYSSGGVVTGTISGVPARVSFFRGSAEGTGGGQDFQFDQLAITTGAGPVFSSQNPVPGSLGNVRTNVSFNLMAGAHPINTASIAMKVDGVSVTPTIATLSGVTNMTTVKYTPGVPLSGGALHTVLVTLADTAGNLFTNSWTFTTGVSDLPVTLAGPFVAGNGVDLVIATAAGDAWLGTNYNASSSRTLYTRYTMVFHDLNGETGGGGGYGGLQFFQDNSDRVIAGNAWASLNWSRDYTGDQQDLSPVVPVILGEPHTIVIRTDYSPSGNDVVRIWLDPDFSQQEANQPNAPVTLNVDNSFNNIRLRCGNGTASATWSNIIFSATSVGVGFVPSSDPQFVNVTPADGSLSASVSTKVGATVVLGTYGISANNVALSIDGNAVTPTVVTDAASLVISHQPQTPFVPGSVHNAALSVTDNNGGVFSVAWSFTVDSYPTLPVTFEPSINGTVDVTGGGLGTTIWSSQNGWIGDNYGTDSSATLYTRFTMNFLDMNGESGGGGAYGGLHFYRGNTEVLLVGNNWTSVSWGIDHLDLTPDLDFSPLTPIVIEEFHTMVVKTEFVPDANDNITIWLDPDFSLPESSQPNAPLTFSANNAFDSIHLRAGNGSTYAQFTNIVMAATAPGVGFPAVATPSVLSIQKSGANVNVSWTGTGTLQGAPALTGPWSDITTVSPQSLPATNSARFFRVKQ